MKKKLRESEKENQGEKGFEQGLGPGSSEIGFEGRVLFHELKLITRIDLT